MAALNNITSENRVKFNINSSAYVSGKCSATSKEIHISINNEKKRTKEEEPVYKFARASIVADKDLKAGDIIKEEDIWARRPGNGEIPAYDFDKVIGKELLRDVTFNSQLKWSFLK